MRLLALLLLMFLVTPALAQPLTTEQVLHNAVTEVIRPAFVTFNDKAKVLEGSVDALCAAPSDGSLAEARAAFADVALAHARIENYRFGPLTSNDRAERLLLWPDPKGIALRQVQAILSGKDETATDPVALRGKSVAVQGLTALEYVLHGTGAEDLLSAAGDFRCRYGKAIAAAIDTITKELAAEWARDDGIAAHLIHPGPENNDFRTETESLEGLASTLSHGVEAIRDTRLQPFLGGTSGKPAPRAALYWRSGLTIPAIKANFDGLRVLLEGSRIGELAPPDQSWVDDSALFEFSNADRAANDITVPVAAALKDEKQARALNYLVILTGSLQTLVGDNLPAALGLSVGFSALDGD